METVTIADPFSDPVQAAAVLVQKGTLPSPEALEYPLPPKGDTPLIAAARGGNAEDLELLLVAKANVFAVNNGGASALFLAAASGHPKCVDLLVKGGAVLNVVTAESSSTPVFIAAQEGHYECLKILVAAKANIDHVANKGITPVMIAAAEGQDACLRVLVNQGANVNTMAVGGVTPAYIASQQGNADCLRILISARANVNAMTDDGVPPIFIAAQQGHLDCVRELLRGELNLDVLHKGKTPKQVAKGNGHFAVAEMISDAVKCRPTHSLRADLQ